MSKRRPARGAELRMLAGGEMSVATLTGNLAQRCARSLDERITRQAASLGMTVAELAERFDLEIGDPDIRYDPDAQVLSIEHTVRLLPKENP